MKVKRLVSVLLAALLLVSMIPMNAMAALTWSDATQKDRVEVKMMISTAAPKSPTFQSIAAGAAGDEDTITKLKANLKAANEAWSWDESGSIEVNPGDTIWVGFKVNVVDVDQYPLIASYLIGLKYNSDILSPAYNDGSEMIPDDYTADDFKGGFVLNGSSSGAALGGWRVNATALKDSVKGPLLKQYSGGLAVDTATGARVKEGVYSGEMPISITTNNNKSYPANTPGATWDFAFPMYVKDGAKGTATLEMVSPLGSTSSEVVISGAVLDGNTALSTKQIAINGANVTRIQSNDVTVKIASNDPDLEVADADKTAAVASGNATLVVSTNGKGAATFTNDAKTASKWTVTQTGQTPSVSSVTLSADNKKATLSVTGVDAGEISVTGDASVLTGGSGTLSTVKFTGVAAPTGTFAHDTYTVTASATGTSIKVKGDTAWTDVVKTDKTITLTTNQQTALNKAVADGATVNDAIEIALKDNKDVKSTIAVTKGAAPTAPTIDYTEEKTSEIPTTVEYKIGTATTYTAGAGAKVALTPGTNLTYRTKATASALASSDKTLTVAKRPTLTVTAGSDTTVEQQGKTKVTVSPTTGAVYTKDTNATATTVSGGTSLTSGNIDLTLEQYLHAQIPATASAFASTIVNVQGKGWNYSKVDVTNKSLDVDQTTITLTKTGPIDWAAFSASNFEMKDADSTTTINVLGLDTTTGVLTLASAPEKGKNYVLTVKKAAIAGGALNSKSGTDTPISLTGPTDDAVSVSAGDGYTLDITTISKGAEATLTVTAGLDGKSITAVTSSDTSKLTVIEFSGKTIKVKASDSVSGTATSNSVTLTITAAATPLEYAETTSVELADATAKTIAPTNASDLTGVTVTVAPVGSAPAAGVTVEADNLTLKTAGDKFSAKGNYQYKVTGSNGAEKTITIAVTGVQATPDFSGVTKKWDGTDSLTTNVTGEVAWKDKTGTALTPTANTATYKLSNTDVATTGNVAVTAGTLTADGVTYDVAAGTYDVTVSAADVATVSVAEVKAKPGTVAATATEIGKAEVTATTDTGVTVKAKLSDIISEADIKAILVDKLQQAALPEATEKAQKDWIAAYKEENPDADDETVAAAAAAAADAIEAAAKAAVEADITDASSIKSGTDVSFDLPYTMADGSQKAAKSDAKLNDNVNEKDLSAESIEVKASVRSSGGGGSSTYVPSVELDTNGFATADGPVELDENNKITKLPGVTGQKLGSIFKGWATQEGNPNTIVKEGREITVDTTLYGIFEGYMNGDTNNSGKRVARPNDPVTRGELVTMLVRAAGLYDDGIDYTTNFADAKGAWFTPYVGCAETAGILEGDKEGTARPRDNITREEAAILIAKTFKVDVAIGGTTEYVVDFSNTASWAKDYVAAIVNNGTAIGNDHKEYEPKKNITRAEVAAMINKYLGLTASQKTNLSGDSSVTSPFTDVQNQKSWYYAEMVFATLSAPDTYYGTEVVYPTR